MFSRRLAIGGLATRARWLSALPWVFLLARVPPEANLDSKLLLVSATGNRFALFDGMDHRILRDASALARELGERKELGLDGLLQLLPAREDGDCRMVLHNMDGSRAGACGNGLRCIAMRVRSQGYVDGPRIRVETDRGLRVVDTSSGEAGRGRARASMGPVRMLEPELLLEVRVPASGATIAVTVCVVDAGNPHCVMLVDDVAATPVGVLGPILEHHEHFPDRTNVGFVEICEDRLRARVWERGVGETRSCGTGAAAAAVVAVERGLAVYPVRVEMNGGVLVVLQERGELFLEGEVEVESRRFLTMKPEYFAEPKVGGEGSAGARELGSAR